MTKTWLLLVVLSVAGCDRTDAVKTYESWADEACACKDAECADKLGQRLNELAKKYSGVKMQRADTEAILAAGQRGGKCLVEAKNVPKDPKGEPKP